MKLKVFLTGATGFVGAYLSQTLRSPTRVIYGTCYPDRPEDSDRMLADKIYYQDIRDAKGLSALFEEIRPDWVFHLAAVSSVRRSWDKREETFDTNLAGTYHLFEAIRQYSPQARVLYVSSSDVYGVLAPVKKALSEDDRTEPVNPYAYTKISGELLARFYSRIEGLDIVCARPFPHTGPGQSADFVCPDWALQIAQIEKGDREPVMTVGNTQVQRDFLDVRDVVRAYVCLMEKGRKGEVYNICSGRAIALKEVLDMLLSLTSSAIEIRVDPQKLRKTDIPLLVGDNQKIHHRTSWKPKISIKQTLIDLLEYSRSSLV
ncbi:MAG: GDP-mannose 4,6-dehydratase [Candidatus Aminicenantaceae bacterium]